MSRTRKAIITAGFGYTQFALAMVSGILLIPLILSHLETRTYGLWLATGQLLAYASILDLGVFGVLPWLVADADGRKDRETLRSLIVRGLVIGLCVGLAFIFLFGFLWWIVPGLLNLTDIDRITLRGPLALLALGTLLVYPLRVFSAVLIGLQDAAFNGILTVLQFVLNIVITLVLLLSGYGLYALAAAVVSPQIVTMCASLLRVRWIAPDLFKGWHLPSLTSIKKLFSQSIGVWLGGYGWQLVAASSGLIIAYLGHPEWVPIYVCTAKLSQLFLQISWTLPDSGLVGLAQLHGEGRVEQVQKVIGTMLRLHLLLSGGAACIVLALNPSFVNWWVGPNYFGGLTLSTLLAFGLIWLSLIHGLISVSAVLGNRFRAGMAQLLNGLVHLILAVLLGSRYGLVGIATATILSSGISTLPFSTWLMSNATGLRIKWLLVEVAGRWLLFISPLLALAYVLGRYNLLSRAWHLGLLGIGVCIVYLWWMHPLYNALSLDYRLARWLPIFRFRFPLPNHSETSVERN